jgi:hypothetical protein
MFSKTLSTVAVALAASHMAAAQTFTECNPLEKSMFLPNRQEYATKNGVLID